MVVQTSRGTESYQGSDEKIDISKLEYPQGCPKIEFYRYPNYYEITCSLFTKCNLNCDFCSQVHVTDLNETTVLDMAYKAFEATEKDFETYKDTLKKLEVRFWGGELYSDNIPMSYFLIYNEFITLIKELYQSEYPWLEIEFITTTNGVLTNLDRLKWFLKSNDMHRVSVSYDYIGRYKTKHQEKLALNTIKSLSDSGFDVNVGIILTKRAINHILQDKTELTKFFTDYNASTINFNFYIPNEGWEVDMPDDNDLWNVYKLCLDNHLYNVKTIFYLMETYLTKKYLAKECECKFLPNVFETGTSKNCIRCFSNLENKLFYGKYADSITDENVSDVKASLGICKRGCLSCEHSEYCQMPCWSSVIFEHFKPTECPLSKAYKYITDEHITEYNKWRDTKNGFKKG